MISAMDGVIVVDLTSNVAGPYATSILRDMGATIWKVENSGGDVVRGWPPFAHDVSTTFASLNRGKRSIGIDLKAEEGRGLLEAMVARADVVIESMRPGAFAKLGFTSERLQAINPRIVCASITAYGPVGPRAGEPGFDAIIQAHTGIMNLTGHPDQEPARVGTGLIDFGTGMWAAMGVLAALLERERTGQGGVVDATLFGTAVGFMPHHLASVVMAGVVPQRIGTAQHNSAPYEAIQARDALVMVGVANDGLWSRFLDAIDDGRLAARDDLLGTNAKRVANRPLMQELINSLTSEIGAEELVARLAEKSIPCSVIRDVGDLPQDPQMEAMKLIRTWDDGSELTVLPIAINGRSVDTAAGVPALGQQSRQILAEVGVSPEAIDRLVANHVVVARSDDAVAQS